MGIINKQDEKNAIDGIKKCEQFFQYSNPDFKLSEQEKSAYKWGYFQSIIDYAPETHIETA